VHDVEAHAGDGARVVEEVNGEGGCVDLLGIQTKRRRDDVERTPEAGVVHEDDRSAIRGRIVEVGETRLAPKTLGTKPNGLLVAAEIDVLAGERCTEGSSGTRRS
jgi:hypothetical protein